MVLAGTVSCHRTSEAEARLIAIDSLIPVNPDSALTLLEAIEPRAAAPKGADAGGSPDKRKSHADIADHIDRLPPTGLMTRSERAYHALLTAQALYKAYIPATSDSLINIAWDYYNDHGPYDRRIRAMLYKGTTAEELGHPDTAMYWYKLTELESRPDDHYHRGYALERMALLYQGVYKIKLSIAKYRLALSEFEVRNDTSNILYCDLSLSKLYLDYNNDSALFFGNKLKYDANKFERTEYLAYYSDIIGKYLFYDGKFNQAKDSILVYVNSTNEIPNNTFILLALSYARLNMLDSAQFYLKNVKPPFTVNDSIQYYFLKSVLSEKQNDIESSIRYNDRSNELAACEMLESKENNYHIIEMSQQSDHDKTKERRSTTRFYVSAFLIVILVILVGFFLFTKYKDRKQKHEIEELQRFIQELQSLNSKYQSHPELSKSNEIDRNSNTKQDEIIEISAITSNLAESFRFILTHIRKNIGKEKEKLKLDAIIKNALTPSYFSYLHKYVDFAYNGLASEMKASTKLKEEEINVICMYLCRMPSSVMLIYTGLSSIQSVTRQRNHIATKFFGSKEKLESLLTLNKRI